MNDDSAKASVGATTFRIQSGQTDTGWRVALIGQADHRAADQLDRGLLPVIAARPVAVEVDCSQLTFIATLAIGSLVSLAKQVHRSGGRVRCTGLNPQVFSVLKRLNLEHVLDCQPAGGA